MPRKKQQTESKSKKKPVPTSEEPALRSLLTTRTERNLQARITSNPIALFIVLSGIATFRSRAEINRELKPVGFRITSEQMLNYYRRSKTHSKTVQKIRERWSYDIAQYRTGHWAYLFEKLDNLLEAAIRRKDEDKVRQYILDAAGLLERVTKIKLAGLGMPDGINGSGNSYNQYLTIVSGDASDTGLSNLIKLAEKLRDFRGAIDRVSAGPEGSAKEETDKKRS